MEDKIFAFLGEFFFWFYILAIPALLLMMIFGEDTSYPHGMPDDPCYSCSVGHEAAGRP